MIKRYVPLILTTILTLLLTGCGSTVSQSEYDAVCAERDELQAALEEVQDKSEELQASLDKLQAELEELQSAETISDTVTVNISGGFAATVQCLLPDYTSGLTEHRVAVMTLFQDAPFALYVGELGERLEVGKTYVFEMVTEENVEITKAEYQSGASDPVWIIPYCGMQVKSFREAGEGEFGLEEPSLVYELQD